MNLKEKFDSNILWLNRGLDNVLLALSGTYDSYYKIEYSVGFGTDWDIYRKSDQEVYYFDKENKSFVNTDSKLTYQDVKSYEELLKNSKFAYFGGYLINLTTGEWQCYSNSKEDTIVSFYNSYIDFLWNDELTEIDFSNMFCPEIKNHNYNSEARELFYGVGGAYSDDRYSIEDNIIYGGFMDKKYVRIENFTKDVKSLVIRKEVEFFNCNAFEPGYLENIVIDSHSIIHILNPKDNHTSADSAEYVKALSSSTNIVYIKNIYSMSQESPFFEKFSEVASDKTGYKKFVKKI